MNPFFAELIGTALILICGAGVVANVLLDKTKGNNSGWMVITTGWALGVYIAVVVAAPFSGAHLNPAISVALVVAGKFSIAELPTYLIAQFLGAALGALIVWVFYYNHFEGSKNALAKRAVFCTDPAIRNYPINFLNELIATFILVFVVLFFSGAELINEKGNVPIGLGSLGALPVALLVWVIGLALGGTTGYAINPARDFSPRIVHALLPIKNKASNDWTYSLIPLIAPIFGGVLAALCYKALLL